MKSLFTLFAVALLGVAASACGGTKRNPSAPSTPAAATTSATAVSSVTPSAGAPLPHYPGVRQFPGDIDGDNDRDSDEGMHGAGYEAPPNDRQAIDAVVKRYYAIAVAGDGKQACSMLAAPLLKSLPIDYGRYGPSYLRGKDCVGIMSTIFRHLRRLVVSVAGTMKVIDVRLEGDHGYAALHVNAPCIPGVCVLNTRKLNISIVPIKWEGKSWKIASPLAVV